MADGFVDLEFGLRIDVLVKEILTCSLLNLSYSIDENTMCDYQEEILKAKEKSFNKEFIQYM